MDLTPIYEGQKAFGAGQNLVVLNSNAITVLNVQTDEVKRQAVGRALRVAGTLEVNEASKTIIASPSPGRIQTSSVDFPGVEVEKGQMLITLFSPELVQRRSYLRTVGGDQPSVGQGLMQAGKGSNPYLVVQLCQYTRQRLIRKAVVSGIKFPVIVSLKFGLPPGLAEKRSMQLSQQGDLLCVNRRRCQRDKIARQ